MPVDYSQVYKPSNFIGKMAAMAQMQQNMLQSRALNQQIQSNVAASEAMQGAIGPDGKVDYKLLSQRLSQDPRAAYKLPEIMGQAAQQRKMQLEEQQIGQQMALEQLESMYTGLLGAETPQLGVNYITDLVQRGGVTPEAGAQVIGRIAAVANDPAKYEALRRQTIAAVEGNINNLKPTIETQKLGDMNMVVRRDPITGAIQGTESYAVGMTPDAAARPVEGIDPYTGAPTRMTTAQFSRAAGGGYGGGNAMQGAGQAQGGGMQQFMQPPLGIPSGLAVGQEKDVDLAIERYNENLGQMQGRSNTVQSLTEAEKLLREGALTGVGTDPVVWGQSLAKTLGVDIVGDPTKSQELRKYLKNQLGDAAAAAGFVGSSEKLDLFGKGQPNPSEMTPEALLNATQYVRAQTQGAIARTNFLSGIKNQRGGNMVLPKAEAAWAKVYDPNAMFVMTASPETRATFLSKLNDSEAEKLKKSIAAMDEMGAFDD